jgi:hypothetical protein
MLMRGIAAGALLLVLCQAAWAEERPGIIHRVSCTVVRFYVAKYSAAAAEMWARNHGATEAAIESARKCIGGSNVQAASLAAK